MSNNCQEIIAEIREPVTKIAGKIEAGGAGGVGPKGDKGDPGQDGYTPIKGVDYYTVEDINGLIHLGDSAPEDGTAIIWMEKIR